MVQFHLSACGCPVFPTAFIEDTVLFPLYILGYFAVNELTTYAWVYLWVLYSVPLIYVPVFMPILYYFDSYSFVI